MPLGALVTPRCGWREGMDGCIWAADTGCYAQGDSFDLARYLAWLERMRPYRHTCLFATAPDVVGDAAATWERSRAVLPVIRALGYLPALVAQDGIERLPVEWEAFGALFLGGTTAWKLSLRCAGIACEARSRDKLVHMGRVNSYVRLSWAQALGCQSCDGTFLRKAPDDNLPRLERWLRRLRAQPSLPFWDVEAAG
jgi:hypothetical protein